MQVEILSCHYCSFTKATSRAAFLQSTCLCFQCFIQQKKKGWMNNSIFSDWLYKHFVHQVRRYLQSKSISEKVVLLLEEEGEGEGEGEGKGDDDDHYYEQPR